MSILSVRPGGQRRSPVEAVGLDIGASGVKAIRLRKTRDDFEIVDAHLFEPLDWSSLSEEDEQEKSTPYELPKSMACPYMGLCYSGHNAVVRLLSLPGIASMQISETVAGHMAMERAHRISHVLLAEGRGKNETRVMAVAMLEHEASWLLEKFQTGLPAPASLEMSSLSALNWFQACQQKAWPAVSCFIESGQEVTLVTFFRGDQVVLVRKFDFGSSNLVKRICASMKVDEEVARGILSDGAFDISHIAHDAMLPFLRQLSISRDFIERKESASMESLTLSGGLSGSSCWGNELASGLGVTPVVWNPLERIEGDVPEIVSGCPGRYAAALGAAFGVLAGES